MGRTRVASVAAVLGLSVWLLSLPTLTTPAAAMAQAPQPRAPVADGAPTAAEATDAPTELTPLIADFDGDHRSDVFMYGPGGLPDHLWLGRPDRAFVGSPATVGRRYLPLVGDFNGNGRADILWYGPGAAPDVLWYGKPGGQFSGSSVTVRGTYQPLLGDFNGDRRGDIFWYGPGGGNDVVWYGRSTGGFTGRAATVNGTYQPLVVAFNGDGRRDILWYGPGDAPDVLWFGHPDGRFSGRAVDVAGTYQPFTGDFDADGRRDIFWYGPGGGYDVVRFGRADGRFGAAAATVRGTYQPRVGDFGGDGPNDGFWYAPGDPDDILWFGHADRRFTSRATTIDIGHTRALPLRPETIVNRYDPYGFVAHAFGAIDGHGYTNSLEAFQRNYRRGFRVFEVDLVRLADGTALLAHDGLEANYGLNKSFRDATWADLADHRYLDRYTILRSQDLVRLLAEHPDAYVILDSKWERLDIYRTILGQAPQRSLRERILPHVEDQAELNAFRTAYPLQNYVLALYHTQYRNLFDDPQVVDFTRRNRTPAVTMWWRERDFSLDLAGNSRHQRRFSQPFTEALQAAGAVVYVHSLGDPAQVQRFWDLRVGVNSDEPFPPLQAGTLQQQELILPTFPEGVIPA